MAHEQFTSGLLDFLQSSPSPFHAVRSMGELLEAAGFEALREGDSWRLAPGRGYWLSRNGSSLIAFRTGSGDLASAGLRMAGAHTDSPCLKIKPQPEISRNGYLQLGVEVYGGALLNPWFDRDLSIAGRVSYLDGSGAVRDCLIDFKKAVAVIPSLAIHLDREVNQNRSINAQNHLPPLLMQQASETHDFRSMLKELLRAQGLAEAQKVLDYELCLYDVQPPALVGLKNQFLAGARLDNLLSCYVGLQALLRAGDERPALLVCSDHEEVGSVSAAGANGPFLESVLERLAEQLVPEGGRSENFRRMLSRSLMVSLDNAHGIHPNYADKHDQQHGPLLNHGPVIKVNANQRYATSSETSAIFRRLCEEEKVPVQSFVVRSDMGCGSTIGPIVAGQLGVRTLDVGIPTFAMHSIRELAGAEDAGYLFDVVTRYFNT